MKPIRADTKDLTYFRNRERIPVIGKKWLSTADIIQSNENDYVIIELDFFQDGKRDLLVFHNGHLIFHAISKERDDYLRNAYRFLIQKKGIKRKTFMRRLINAFILREIGLVKGNI